MCCISRRNGSTVCLLHDLHELRKQQRSQYFDYVNFVSHETAIPACTNLWYDKPLQQQAREVLGYHLLLE